MSKRENVELYDRPLPSSEDSENAVIGSMLQTPSNVAVVAGALVQESFYYRQNGQMFKAIISLFQAGKHIDVITVIEEAKRLDGSCGVTVHQLSQMQFGLPFNLDLSSYITTIREKHRARQAITKCNQIIADLLVQEEQPDDVLQAGLATLTEIQLADVDQEVHDLTTDIDASVAKAHHIQESGNPITGLSTGFADIDAQTAGLQNKDLIVIAARPSMGKTALVLTILINIARNLTDGFAVFFSMEMNREQVIMRLICSCAGVNLLKYRSGLLSPDDWDRIEEARDFLTNLPLIITDEPRWSPSASAQFIRKCEKQTGKKCRAAGYDYVQMMDGDPDERYNNRQEEMTKISRRMKALAKMFDMPVLELSQLSRAPEARVVNNHRPMMSDLRESGSLEQDADVVAFIYREEMYPKKDGTPVAEGEAEFIIGKQRNGPTGTIRLAFDKQSARFNNYTSDF